MVGILYFIIKEGGKVSWIRAPQRAWRSSDLYNYISDRRQRRAGCKPNVTYTLQRCIHVVVLIYNNNMIEIVHRY